MAPPGDERGASKALRRAVTALALAHAANDLYMGFLPALLPLLVARLGLSLTRAGALVSIVSLASQLTQPLLGHLADRIGRRLLVIVGPLLTTLAMASLGLMGSYELLLIALLCGSLGNSAFHPQGAALSGKIALQRSHAAPERQSSQRTPPGTGGAGLAMAVFTAGGNIGYGLGPVLVIAIVGLFGLSFTWLTIPLGLAAVAFVAAAVPRSVDSRPEARSAPVPSASRVWLRSLAVLWSVVALRAAAAILFTTFVPLLISRRHQTLMLGAWTLLGFSLAGALGGLVGGPTSDRLGRRSVTVVSLILAGPAFFLFLRADGPAAAGLLLLTGSCLFAALPVNLVMAQEILPRRASMVSGLMMGLAWAVGGLSTTVVGALADHLAVALGPVGGLARALDGAALIPLAAAALALALPETRGPQRQ